MGQFCMILWCQAMNKYAYKCEIGGEYVYKFVYGLNTGDVAGAGGSF